MHIFLFKTIEFLFETGSNRIFTGSRSNLKSGSFAGSRSFFLPGSGSELRSNFEGSCKGLVIGMYQLQGGKQWQGRRGPRFDSIESQKKIFLIFNGCQDLCTHDMPDLK